MPVLLKKNGEITPFRNAEYISAFYFIPKSILDKFGEEINSIPEYNGWASPSNTVK